jgi:cell division protein FtsB
MLKADLSSRNKSIQALEEANTDLIARLAKAEAKIEDLDSYSRRDNLLITGLTIILC